MTEATIKVKGGTITLPKPLRRSWGDVQIFVRAEGDTLILKKIQPPSFWDMWESLKPVKGQITKKDIAKAIVWGRKRSHRL